jgi:hypothetical protein
MVQYYHFSHVRHLLINRLLQGEMKLLVIGKEEARNLQWKKHNKEFVYKGQMYDIARMTTRNGSSFIYCYRDVNENRLITLFNQKKPGDQALRTIVSKILLTHFILPNSGIGILPNVSEFEYLSFHTYFYSCKADIHSPPPKHFCFA